jgi:exodeoxyribonuclease VII large subunit
MGAPKPEPLFYGDRKVFTVGGFNQGIADWLGRLPQVWVEGELTELTRQQGRPMVFFTLKDAAGGASVGVTMRRAAFDALELELVEGARVHVLGRAELWRARGTFRLHAETIELFGLGQVLARLEALKRKLAAEGLFDPARKRPLPTIPRLVGVVTGSDAAAKHDVLATITARFPPARVLVAETYVQGPRAPGAIAFALRRVCEAGADVIVLARGGGSFEDLLPFSDERLLRTIAACPVPIVSAVGHEQDTPLCDLVADARASTPTAAARLVVPDHRELLEGLERDRLRLLRAPALLLERKRGVLAASLDRLRRAPALLVERRRAQVQALAAALAALSPAATLGRGYAIVRREGAVVRTSATLSPDELVDVQLAAGSFAARVSEVRE